MKHKEITFDRFVRGLIMVVGLILIYLLLLKLSSVLVPFFVAWLMAYMLYPLVCFFQYKCKVKYRLPSILLALTLIIGLFSVACYFIIPPVIEECGKVKNIIIEYASSVGQSAHIDSIIERFTQNNINLNKIMEMISVQDITSFLEERVPQLFSIITSSVSALVGLIGSLIAILYMFFILMDYEHMSDGAINLVPKSQRQFVAELLNDVEQGMNGYFRGQALIAFIVGILFSIGFTIIDLPLAIPLGLLIGLFNLVPYLQTIGILPTVLLALIKSYDTGESIWQILFLCLLVFIIVQSIQDAILTPKIMGKVTGLNGAVILLSLSVWGSLLGFVGLIIALPLTTLLVSYYKRFVLEDSASDKKNEEKSEKKS
ncbi:MAG: AI-2E family transporter [Bacteroidaceae bacterium]|nr:AI-2E family transporter [Bacteroidaceae bacterium]